MRADNPVYPNVLLLATGSVAAIKLVPLVRSLLRHPLNLRLILTSTAARFVDASLPTLSSLVTVHTDTDEWTSWREKGDPVLHIELRKWADLLLIAPLS